VYHDRTLELRFGNRSIPKYSKLGSKELELLLGLDQSRNQSNPNWIQMEESKGLEVIETKDIEVGLR